MCTIAIHLCVNIVCMTSYITLKGVCESNALAETTARYVTWVNHKL